MKIKVLIGILVFLILLNLATIGTWVYLHFFSSPIPVVPRMERLFQGPRMHFRKPPLNDLTPSQRHQLGQLFREMRREKQPIENRIRQLHMTLREALLDTTVQEDSLQVLLDSLATLQQQLNKITIKHFLKARQFLTPEQQNRIFRRLMLPRSKPGFSRLHRHQGMSNYDNKPPKHGRTLP